MKLGVKMLRLRQFAVLILLAGVGYGAATNNVWGTLCAICPVGMLEVSLAGKILVPDVLAVIAFGALAAVILGKVFCAWGCPTTLFNNKQGEMPAAEHTREGTEDASLLSGFGILGAALLSTFIVGFPVFCLICPVGLVFLMMFSLFKLFSLHQPGWELIVVPVMLTAEFMFLRSWCRSFCALGAFFSIASRLVRLAPRPVILGKACLAAAGCRVCANNCPEQLDPWAEKKFDAAGCTLCLECYEKCPVKAIGLRMRQGLSASPAAGIPSGEAGK